MACLAHIAIAGQRYQVSGTLSEASFVSAGYVVSSATLDGRCIRSGYGVQRIHIMPIWLFLVATVHRVCPSYCGLVTCIYTHYGLSCRVIVRDASIN